MRCMLCVRGSDPVYQARECYASDAVMLCG